MTRRLEAREHSADAPGAKAIKGVPAIGSDPSFSWEISVSFHLGDFSFLSLGRFQFRVVHTSFVPRALRHAVYVATIAVKELSPTDTAPKTEPAAAKTQRHEQKCNMWTKDN